MGKIAPELSEAYTHESNLRMQEFYRNRGLRIATTDDGGTVNQIEDGLFNPVKTQNYYKREKPWHRVAAELAASGHTHMEIATALNKSRRAVQNVLQQPFAQERIVKKAAENAATEIREMLESAAPESLRRIINLAETAAESESVEFKKIGADMDKHILDRFLGKPNQPITREEKEVKNLTDQELDQRVNEIISSATDGADGVAEPSEYS